MQDVAFQCLPTQDGRFIGHICLNRPQALNALSREMVAAMYQQLELWQFDPNIAMVFVDSNHEKAFCAGGDVRALAVASFEMNNLEMSGLEMNRAVSPLVAQFFYHEYRLNYLAHTYGKPFLVWGHGIVMGGGMGLLMGASHRIVTEQSRLAMPEVTIGLYPDAGASYFLSRLPQPLGLFLGLSGAILNATDALALQFATHLCANQHKQQFLNILQQQVWAVEKEARYAQLDQCLAQLSRKLPMPQQPEAELQPYQAQLSTWMQGTLAEIWQRWQQLELPSPWFEQARKTMLAGSPQSWRLIEIQMQECRSMSLAACFEQEYIWSLNCCRLGDFYQGVRALLIDKCRQPQWQFSQPARVSDLQMQGLQTPVLLPAKNSEQDDTWLPHSLGLSD